MREGVRLDIWNNAILASDYVVEALHLETGISTVCTNKSKRVAIQMALADLDRVLEIALRDRETPQEAR